MQRNSSASCKDDVKSLYKGCGKEGIENPKDLFQKATVPASILSHSIATPSLVAQVMYQKFAMEIPFNRQEKDWYRLGLVLPRADMTDKSSDLCHKPEKVSGNIFNRWASANL